MSFYFVQFVTGLASACSLFLVASGLSIIFGVTRIVNFAHGAFYMLGAYVAYSAIEHLGPTIGFWPAAFLACLAVAAIGALVEMTLLRRIYDQPELFQLLATFGVTLMVEDLVLIVWGPDELLGPRAPGLKGAVSLFGRPTAGLDSLNWTTEQSVWKMLERQPVPLLVERNKYFFIGRRRAEIAAKLPMWLRRSGVASVINQFQQFRRKLAAAVKVGRQERVIDLWITRTSEAMTVARSRAKAA